MTKITLLGIDLAKNVFQLHGIDAAGGVVLRKKVPRSKLVETIAQLPVCTIAMEACSGSSHWSRRFESLGHQIKLINPQYVKPFVKTNKNDQNDAEGICEAASRPSMHFVAPNTIEQQDMQALHRIRSRLVGERTALVNQIRGLLAEYGIVIPVGVHKVPAALPSILEDAENELSDLSRQLFSELYDELNEMNEKIKRHDKRIQSIFKTNTACQRIAEIGGIGPVVGTAIVSKIGEPSVFKNGRHFAAYLGLVPKQSSSGGKERLLGVSKRGDVYVRSLLIHGARSVIRHVGNKTDQKSTWIRGIVERRGANRAAVALANKTARVIWAILAKEQAYQKVS